MNIIYLKRRDGIDTGLEELKRSFPASSRILLTEENRDLMFKRMATPPMYSEGWFIEFAIRGIPNETVLRVCNEPNVCLFVTTDKTYAEELSLEFKALSLEFRYVNDEFPSKEELNERLLSGLKITPKLAEYLGSRAGWRLDIIESSLITLKHLKKVTTKDINMYVPYRPNVSMDEVVNHIAGLKGNRTERELYTVIERYNTGTKFLYAITIQRLNLYLWIYENIKLGLLSSHNYKEFRSMNLSVIRGFGEYASLSEYKFRLVVEAYQYLTEDNLRFRLYLAQKCKEANPTLLGFLNLMRMVSQ